MQILSIPTAAPPAGLVGLSAIHEEIEVTDYNRDGYSDLVMLRNTRFSAPGSMVPTDAALDLVTIPGGMGLAFGGRWIETRISVFLTSLGIPNGQALLDYDNDDVVDYAAFVQEASGFQIQVWRCHENGSFSAPISRSLPAVLNTPQLVPKQAHEA